MPNQFKIGDTVHLKSGSPAMTVIKVTASDKIPPDHLWVRFHDNGLFYSDDFPAEAVKAPAE